MAEIDGELWKYNLAKVTFVDVSDDYQTLMEPMPSDLYPIVHEEYLPKYRLLQRFLADKVVCGYMYDWHEAPDHEGDEHWYVGVVSENMV